MVFDKDCIMMVEFEESYGGHQKTSMVALYNQNKVTDVDVTEAIALNGMGYSPNIVIMTKEQYINVFMTSEEQL